MNEDTKHSAKSTVDEFGIFTTVQFSFLIDETQHASNFLKIHF
ncbi:hypothetical protein [Methanobrevibacter sp.]